MNLEKTQMAAIGSNLGNCAYAYSSLSYGMITTAAAARLLYMSATRSPD